MKDAVFNDVRYFLLLKDKKCNYRLSCEYDIVGKSIFIKLERLLYFKDTFLSLTSQKFYNFYVNQISKH